MTRPNGRLALASLALAGVVALGGCASSQSTKARALKPAEGVPSSLADCQNITVSAFRVPSSGKVDASVGVSFARDIERRLANDFGPIFSSVAYAETARGLPGECLVAGEISTYRPGSRFARAMLIGLGSASFEGRVTVRDASGGQPLLDAPFDKLWAWGGILGASKGIDDMVGEASASVAATLAQAKGWSPAADQ